MGAGIQPDHERSIVVILYELARHILQRRKDIHALGAKALLQGYALRSGSKYYVCPLLLFFQKRLLPFLEYLGIFLYSRPHNSLDPVLLQNIQKPCHVVFCRVRKDNHINGLIPERDLLGKLSHNSAVWPSINDDLLAPRRTDECRISLAHVKERNLKRACAQDFAP